MDKGMKKVVNLVTNYMSALCETGAFPVAWIVTSKPGPPSIFRAAGKPLVNGVVRIDEQDMKDILAAAPKSQRGWIRTRLGYMVAL